MKLRILLCAVVVAFAAREVVGHVGTMVFPIWELPAHALPDLHDGSVSDWEDITPESSLYLLDFEGAFGAGNDLPSLAARTFLGWSDATQRIYFAIERVDDVYINVYEGGGDVDAYMECDYALLQVDGDHTGGDYFPLFGEGYNEEEAAEFVFSQAQSYHLYAEPANDEIIRFYEGRKGWATRMRCPPGRSWSPPSTSTPCR